MATIDSDDYKFIVEDDKLTDKMSFLLHFNIFEHLSKNNLMGLTHFMEEKNCIRNSVLYKKGDDVNGIYLISEGEFEETMEFVTDMSAPSKIPHHGKFPYFKGSF